MNFQLSHLPDRTNHPRQSGLTMVMDKGLSLRETEDFLSSSSSYTDLVKLGFGSAIVTQQLEKKIALYKEANIPIYFGGTLCEAYIVRDDFKGYVKLVEKYKLTHAEISDGSITIPHTVKCNYIKELSKVVTVISEVGSKEEGILIRPAMWIEMMERELECGSWKVIAEARESGTVGIYRPNGKAHVTLINKITNRVSPEKIIWEAPIKSQQVYFIKHFGANVNLGNISPIEVIALESLRLGLRSDTFFQFLEK
jgi:phosphosulfolactate synthase